MLVFKVEEEELLKRGYEGVIREVGEKLFKLLDWMIFKVSFSFDILWFRRVGI